MQICCDSGVCVSVCLSVYSLVKYLSEPCKNGWTDRQFKMQYRLGETDYCVRRSIHMLSVVQMGATWRVSQNDNNLYCYLGLRCRSINFHKLDINLSKQYAIIWQGQGFCSYGLACRQWRRERGNMGECEMVAFRAFWWYYFSHVYISGPITKSKWPVGLGGQNYFHPLGDEKNFDPLNQPAILISKIKKIFWSPDPTPGGEGVIPSPHSTLLLCF